MAASKLWYTGRVLDPPSYHLKEIKRAIFHFVYGITANRKKPELLRRENLFLNWGEGGIGLVDISLKLKAFRIVDMTKIVLEAVGEQEVSHNTQMALYWCGGSLNTVVKLNEKHTLVYDINEE